MRRRTSEESTATPMGESSALKMIPVPMYGVMMDIRHILSEIERVPVLDAAADVLGIKTFLELACITPVMELDADTDELYGVSEEDTQFQKVFRFLEDNGFTRREFIDEYGVFRVRLEFDVRSHFRKEAQDDIDETGFILGRWVPGELAVFNTLSSRLVPSTKSIEIHPPKMGGYCRHWPIHRDDEGRAGSAFSAVSF